MALQVHAIHHPSESLGLKDRLTAVPSVSQGIWLFFLLSAGFGLCQFIINISLLDMGILSDITINFGARAMLAYDGAPPKLENIGGIYPPIPYFLVLVFRDPVMAAAMAGGAVQAAIVCVINSLRKAGSIGRLTELICIICIMFLPQVLFVFTQRIDLSLTLCAFTLTMWSLRRVELYGRTYHLTLCSLCMALLYLCDAATLLLCLLFAPYIAKQGLKVHNSIIAVLVLTYLPLVFFALIQRPISLLFLGDTDPFTQWSDLLIVSQGIDLIEARPGEGSIVAAFMETVRRLSDISYMLSPWVAAWVIMLVRGGWRLLFSMHKYLLAPLLYCFWSLYLGSGIFEQASSAFLIFSAQALLLTTRDFSSSISQDTVKKNRKSSFIVALGMILGLAGGWADMMHSPDRAEQQFARALLHQQRDSRIDGLYRLFDAVHDTQGKILMDTERNMSLIFFSGTPRRFLLPYQLDYEMGLSLPAAYVDYVVVYADPTYDGIARKHPSVMHKKLAGFSCIAEHGKRLVFKRQDESAQDYLN